MFSNDPVEIESDMFCQPRPLCDGSPHTNWLESNCLINYVSTDELVEDGEEEVEEIHGKGSREEPKR